MSLNLEGCCLELQLSKLVMHLFPPTYECATVYMTEWFSNGTLVTGSNAANQQPITPALLCYVASQCILQINAKECITT